MELRKEEGEDNILNERHFLPTSLARNPSSDLKMEDMLTLSEIETSTAARDIDAIEEHMPTPNAFEAGSSMGNNSRNASLGEEESDEEDARSSHEFNNKRIVLQRFTIYNSLKTMYIVGSNAKENLFRVLEVGQDPGEPDALLIIEDKSYFYTRKDMIELINELNDSIEGGIHKISRGYGLLGFIKFTKGYYLSIITKCSQVAILGGHYVYHVDETKLIPLDVNYRKPEKYSDEEKLLSIFKYLDLGKTFYFSYTYDITNTLQTNFLRNKKLATEYQFMSRRDYTFKGHADQSNIFELNDRFVWNNLLLEPILKNNEVAIYEWFQPIIHGFIDQANISIYGKKIFITLIARRSHHFAGPRFLKRGVNDEGNVANEVETEQIVSDMLVTPFHDPKYGFYNNPRYTSFVQHRGSIPLYWTQDLNRLPKPPIEINLSDPFYQSSGLHFNNLFERYGSPIIILNLIKAKERQPRELKLNQSFSNCINYLNQFLPERHKLQFNCFDMSKNSKKNLDVIGPLKTIASSSIKQIGFFHNGTDIASTKIQKGIIRTNCIDCLDRTNAAQFITCKEALSHQLVSLGLISESQTLDYDSDLINILTEMFHDHGDTIAVQYGGSNLVNTMDSYRRINQWSSHTRDILNSIKRIYSNSFMDLIRQEAINLFLGNYVYDFMKPKLWELQNDFYLHNKNFIKDVRFKLSYIHWYNENYLSDRRASLALIAQRFASVALGQKKLEPYPDYNDNWYNESYVPRRFQSLSELFQFNMNSNARYFPSNIDNSRDKNFDYSPFESRNPLVQKQAASSSEQQSSQNGKSNIEYLENICNGNDTLSQYDEKQDHSDLPEDRHIVSELKHDHHFPLEYTYGPNYKKLANSRRLKNFLAEKIEKLGYSAKAHSRDVIAKSEEPYSSQSEQNISTPSSVLLPNKTHEEFLLDLKVSEKNRDIYASNIRFTQLLPTLEATEQYKFQTESSIPRDRECILYELSSGLALITKVSHTDERLELLSTDSRKHVDPNDIHIYARYLGIEDEVGLATEDNYFK
ncbi:uncharacterized protein PRCAT00006205001 [Priceomyces carsonii]|uniref:uncharacterized protein n=1 Tax=Priceomyces carsonii TaxID=28549 RepID=UPI002ED95F08|nr:unnamed protein product [Priceomyces carsonii]